jgi:Flp pilus assembly protein TadD
MKNHLLPTMLLGTIAIVSHATPSLALSPVEIQRIAKQTTVQIVGCDRGSGVIIQKNGNTYTVLTVAHAVKDPNCEIVTPDHNRYQVARVVNFPGQIDLAIVVFTSFKNYQVAKLIENSNRVEAGEAIYVSGFPHSTAIDKSVFTFVRGDVVSNSSANQQGKGYSLIYSNNTLPGHSGGPVWNDRGELIAIHGQGDVDSKSQATSNNDVRIKTGYNLGITVNTFTKLATTAGISGYKPIDVVAKPKPVDDLIASAILKNSRGNYRGMLADLNRAIALDAQNARSYSLRGFAKSALEDNRGALEDYDRSITLNPKEPKAYNNRANTKLELGDNQGAIEDYERAIAINPNLSQSYSGRGNAKSRLGDNQGAVENYTRAIALNSNYAEAYHGRGNAKYMLGDKAGSIEDARTAADLYQQQGQLVTYKNIVKAIEKVIPDETDLVDLGF